MKTLREMSLDEKAEYFVGHLTMAIGGGRFHSAVSGMIMSLQTEGYDRGFIAGQKSAEAKKRAKRGRRKMP